MKVSIILRPLRAQVLPNFHLALLSTMFSRVIRSSASSRAFSSTPRNLAIFEKATEDVFAKEVLATDKDKLVLVDFFADVSPSLSLAGLCCAELSLVYSGVGRAEVSRLLRN